MQWAYNAVSMLMWPGDISGPDPVHVLLMSFNGPVTMLLSQAITVTKAERIAEQQLISMKPVGE